MKVEALIAGAFDLHVHCTPDVVPRSGDLVELARAAAEAGLAGILIKDHTTSTAGRVYTLNRLRAARLLFFSCLALNPPVGQLNPAAVEAALREGTDMICFPTYGASNHVAIWGAGKPPTAFPLPAGSFEGVSVFETTGVLKPVCHEILAMVADYDAVLATGHLAPEESLALLQAAARQGVKRMLVTHASEPVTAMSPAQQKAAAEAGAFIEHSFFAVTSACPNHLPLEVFAEQIRQIGPEHVVLSSDFGQVSNGAVVPGFVHYVERMRRFGFGDEELRTMIVDNPRRLMRQGAHEKPGTQL